MVNIPSRIFRLILITKLDGGSLPGPYTKLHNQLHNNIKAPESQNLPEGKVRKLKKSIYGVKESSKNWNTKFNEFLISLKFKRSNNNYCLYVKNSVKLVVHGDDILITGIQ